MPFVILPTNSASGGYEVTNSLRFNRGSSDQLTRSIGTTGNRKTATYSCWIKKCDFTNEQMFLGFTSGLNIYTNGDSFRVNSGTGTAVYSTALQRDPSAWYHFIVAIDTTQATSTNRYRLYVNGTELTSFTTSIYPTQNTDLNINVSGSTQQIGSDGTSHINGYMSELYWIDGQQLTPTSFGETDEDTGIWKPKAFSGTYGTNGFYLQFKNSASLGTDSSGNGNNFTVNNLTSIDQTTDTPTNNFATLNPLIQYYPTYISTFSNGNLDITRTDNGGGHATIMPTKGKWYAEFKCVTVGASNSALGALPYDKITDNEFNPENKGVAYRNNGNKYVDGTSSAYGSTYTSGDIIGIALNLDVGECIFYKNGTAQNSGTAITGFTYDSPMAITCKGGGSGWVWSANFGNPPYSANSYTDGAGRGNFSYSVPSGFYALCTANLSTQG